MQTSLGHLDCLYDYYLLMWLDKQPATCLYQVTRPPNQPQEPTPLAELCNLSIPSDTPTEPASRTYSTGRTLQPVYTK